ncbi:MAG: zinc metallopeptidase [Verrucomicrobiae bacterium]|nr:zinc metallopeptidase [Verrucomicrobiae bacterium]NNJ44061.1 hypothetical protein [Akkermansiaceae bacterium]
MHRLLLILSLLPLLAALILRKLNADRALRLACDTRLSVTANTLARKMLDSTGHKEVELKTRKRSWIGADVIGNGWISLPAAEAEGVTARAHGQAALRVGLYLVSLKNPAVISRRRWALRFGHVFPVFTTLVVVFALMVKLPALWAISIVVGSFGLACCAQILTVVAELQAASIACVLLEKKRTLPRLSDEQAVVAATRAWAWYAIVPGLLSRLM